MLKRKLALGLVLAMAASMTGCKCCGSGSSCSSSPLCGPPPCSSCGTPGVVAPPGAVVCLSLGQPRSRLRELVGLSAPMGPATRAISDCRWKKCRADASCFLGPFAGLERRLHAQFRIGAKGFAHCFFHRR